MKPIVLQYRTPESIIDPSVHARGLIITAQNAMAEGIGVYGKELRNHRQAIGINTLLQALLPDWYGSLRMMRQRLLVRELSERMMKGHAVEMQKVFQNNVGDLLNSIRVLVEIGVRPEDLPENPGEDAAFRHLYQEFFTSPESGVEQLHEALQAWTCRQTFKELISKCAPTKSGHELGWPKAVYFQGFYYIRPMQQRLMEAFIRSELPTYYMNAFDTDTPFSYEIWSGNHRFKQVREVRILPDVKGQGDVSREIGYMKFGDVFSMVKYLRQQKDTVQPFAPVNADVRDMLETFFNKDENKQKILAYPVGQYLWSLYDMWDESVQGLRFDETSVRSCLATGWAGTTYTNSSRLMQTFESVHHYFSDCSSIKDWESRLALLEMVNARILPLFEVNKGSAEEKNCEKACQSPLETIGAFTVSPGEVRSLIETLRQMISDAQLLFKNTAGKIDLTTHFKQVKRLLVSKASRSSIHAEECQILEKLYERLNWESEDITSCSVSHIADAMQFFLGGKRDADNDESIEEEKIGDAYNLSSIEAAHLKFRDGRSVHVFCCDADSLPGKPKSYSWPLSKEYLSRLDLEEDAGGRLQDYLYFMETGTVANRYLFHVATQYPNLTLSWIGLAGDRIVNPSIYLRLLNEQIDELPVISEVLLNARQTADKTAIMDPDEVAEYILTRFSCTSAKQPEIEWDKKYCYMQAWRLFYDYGLGRHSSYRTEFHLSFLFTSLICLIASKGQIAKEKVAEKVFNLYPSFTESKRQEILDWAKRMDQKRIESVNEHVAAGKISEDRIFCSIIPFKMAADLLDNPKLKTNGKCMYCPHVDYCYVSRSGEK